MEKAVKRMEEFSRITGMISGCFMLIVMVVVVINVIARKFFAAPIYGSTEMAQYGMMISASLSLLYNEWYDGNIEMTLITGKLKRNVRLILRILMNFLGFGGFVYVTYYVYMQTAYKYSSGDLSRDLGWRIWILIAILAVGTAMLAVVLLFKTIVNVYQLKSGKDLELHKKRGVPE